MLLVWPDAHTATKDVFTRKPWDYQRPIAFPQTYGTAQQFLHFLSRTKNDLEECAIEITPPIALARAAIAAQKGCRLARMSGSGSTVFGIFDNVQDCAAAQHSIALHNPDWWVRTAEIA